MVELLYYYSIIGLSAGITSVFIHFIPIKRLIALKGMDEHPFVSSPILTGFIWASAVFLFIPLLIKPMLFEKDKQQFITSTYQVTIAD